jgi:hypothetical protein
MTQDYYGTNRVTATFRAQTIFRGPGNSGDGLPGYRIKYDDGQVSWRPKDVFEAAYQPITAMSFGHALAALKAGDKVRRAGWNGKGMFLFLVAGSTFKVSRPPLLGIYPEGTEINYHAHIDMKTADGMVVPWLASQTDMLADDWQIVEDGQ